MTYWILAVLGTTTIVTQSLLLARVRQLFERVTGSRFLYCPMCVGFWIWILGSLIGLTPVTLPNPVLTTFVAGCASSGVCWIGYVILVRLGCKEL